MEWYTLMLMAGTVTLWLVNTYLVIGLVEWARDIYKYGW